ncbi:hypothetical protein VNO78_34291 [Psophocarpus tetragonolobus]|uniref:Pentatricopeptide repeat-containing protein n=1 Tax=Psophocarpus tetragonolobus TaxID=3891 RepID=A0AAN9RPX8_PSOTE
MPDQDVVSWTALIQCLVALGGWRGGILLFSEMKKMGIRPNEFTVPTFLKACSMCLDVSLGKQVHAEVVKVGLLSDMFIGLLWLTYMQNVVKWTLPVSVLMGCANSGDLRDGRPVHCLAIKNGCELDKITDDDVVSWSAMIASLDQQGHSQESAKLFFSMNRMYMKCGHVHDGVRIFEAMAEPDLVSWNSLLSGFHDHESCESGPRTFYQMLVEASSSQIVKNNLDGNDHSGTAPVDMMPNVARRNKANEFTVAGCLGGRSQITATESGMQLHSMTIRAKCGCIEDAETIFNGLVRRDRVLRNTMICVLSACSHMGLIDEGKWHFNTMSNVYGITRDEHHACMVDIFSRAGRFEEVESFVEEMKLTSNDLIWEIVLGACTKQGSVKFGGRAAEKLFKLKHETNSTYILLSNIFAGKGRWADVKKIRA